MDNHFELGGREFSIRKLDAFAQYHIVRRLGPVLSELLPVLPKIQETVLKDSASEKEKFEEAVKLLAPLFEGFAKLSDADADKVLHSLLVAVEVKQSTGNWAKVSNGSLLMFHDLEFPQLLMIAGRAFVFNLGNFFNALPHK